MSELNQLIYKRQMEYVALNDSLGTDFPVVEDNKRRRMAYLEMLIEDLRSLKDEQPTLNENQQIVLEYLKGMCPPKLGVSAMVTVYCLVDDNINDNWQEYSEEIPEHIEALQKLSVAEENQVLELFSKWTSEQEEENE